MYKCSSAYVFLRYNIVAVEEAAHAVAHDSAASDLDLQRRPVNSRGGDAIAASLSGSSAGSRQRCGSHPGFFIPARSIPGLFRTIAHLPAARRVPPDAAS
jgi:hypothetical protein